LRVSGVCASSLKYQGDNTFAMHNRIRAPFVQISHHMVTIEAKSRAVEGFEVSRESCEIYNEST
jgi:hypothetical protein